MRANGTTSGVPARLLLLVFLLTTVPTTVAAAAAVHEGTFAAVDLTWTAGADGRYRAGLGGLATDDRPGAPALPAADLLLLVPTDGTITGVIVEALATHRERVPGLLALVPPATLGGQPLNDPDLPARDPAAWGEFRGTHTWRGYRLAAVRLLPVRPVPGEPDLVEFLDAYAVRLVRTDAPAAEIAVRQRRIAGEPARTRRLVASLVANPDAVTGYARADGNAAPAGAKAAVPTPLPDLAGSEVVYLVVTDEAMAGEFARLAEHRTRRGLPAQVVTREQLASAYRQGADFQETLRLFLQDAYALWGTEYVLLGGDAEILPPRYVNNTLYPAGGSTDIPVDLYFAGLDGNWNANGNHRYGEPGSTGVVSDQADFVPELFVGRAPVATPAAAAVFVDKVLAYENAPAGAGWTNRALFAAEVLFPENWSPGSPISMDGSDLCRTIIETMLEPCTGMEPLRMYQTFDRNPGDVLLSRQAFLDSLDTGHYGLVHHVGHGHFEEAYLGDAAYDLADADALANGADRPFAMVALNCATGGFHRDCLMEHLIRNPGGGAVAAFASTVAAFPVTAGNYQRVLFDQLLCQAQPRAGDLLVLSRLPYVGSTSFNYTDRWTHQASVLLGDPALSLWTSAPQPVAVAAPALLGLGDQTVAIGATRGGEPLVGAMVSLTKAGEDRALGLTDAAGQASLPLVPASAGDAHLVVAGRNLAAWNQAIPVIPTAAYLAVTSVEFSDDGSFGSRGNGDARPDAGERLAVSTVATETGGSVAQGIIGLLSSPTPGVTVAAPGPVAYPNVPAGGSTAGLGVYLVDLAPDLPDGTLLTLEFLFESTAGSTPSRWSGRVLGPEPEVVRVRWDDAAWGDGDGVLDPGERVDVEVCVRNYGAGTASGLTATLTSGDPNVSVHAATTALPDLASATDATGTTPFGVALADPALDGLLELTLADDAGRTWNHGFSLRRPAPPLAAPVAAAGDGPDVIELTWAPSADPDLAGYNVYRATAAAGPFVLANPDPILGTSAYRDDGLAVLTQYWYRVTALTAGRSESLPTASVTRMTQAVELHPFPLAIASETSSHPAVGDVDGDGTFEIVLAADELYVWHGDGTELRDGDNYSESRGPATDLDSMLQPAGVVLAELDGAPGLEMVVSERVSAEAIHVFDHDGQELPGWPRTLTGVAGTRWNWQTPAVGDIDGDGDLEIVVQTLNGVIWAWHADGSEVRDGDDDPATVGVFHVRAGAAYEWSRSGPALCDLDGDGARDIIFGTRSDATGLRRLIALRYDGSDVPGFPVVVDGPVLGGPAIGDLDGDGSPEIVFNTQVGTIYVLRADGSPFPGFPYATGLTFSPTFIADPALGDLDGDGNLDLVFVANVDGLNAFLLAIDTDVAGGTSGTMLPGWPVAVPGSSEASPVLGDLDGDGAVDVLHGIGGGSPLAPNHLYAFGADGSLKPGFPLEADGAFGATPVLTDLDGDGDIEIVAVAWDSRVHVWDLPGAYVPGLCPWPTYGGNPERTRVFTAGGVSAVEPPDELPAAAFLLQAPAPNPFNPTSRIRLHLPHAGNLDVGVYDLRGRRARTLHAGAAAAGWHDLTWDGRDDGGRRLGSGLYLLRAHTGQGQTLVRKLTLLK